MESTTTSLQAVPREPTTSMAHAKLELLATADMASHDAAPAAGKGVSYMPFTGDLRCLPTNADVASHIAVLAARAKAFSAQCELAGHKLESTVDAVSLDDAPADVRLQGSRCTQVQRLCRLPLTQGISRSASILWQSPLKLYMAADCVAKSGGYSGDLVCCSTHAADAACQAACQACGYTLH